MTRRLIATLLAASMAFTSISAAPARAADSGEIGRFLLGAGTLFIIGSAIANSNKSGRHYPPNAGGHPPHRPTGSHPPYSGGHRPPHVTGHHNHHPGHPVRPVSNVLPRACLQVIHTNHGNQRVFLAYCHHTNMQYAKQLPRACMQTAYIYRQPRTVFGARCLRNHGYVFG